MTKIDKDKLNKVNGGLDFDLGGGHIEDPGIPKDRECKKCFDSFSCNGCMFCTVTHNPQNTSIVTYFCQNGYYGTVVYDLSESKIVG